MSLPRRILPGRSYLITRSTRNRRFFLSPSDSGVAIIFWFCIAFAAAITGVQVAAVSVLSTHIHIVLTDVRGELPRFCHWLFRHTSLCLKCLRDIDENVWSASEPSYVELLTPDAIIEAIAYTLGNPASSGLLPRANAWPGVMSRPEDLKGRTVVAEVPGQFFSRRHEPRSLTFSMPPMLKELYDEDDVVSLIKSQIRAIEKAATSELKAKGHSFLGLEAILKTKHTGRPKTKRGGKPGSRTVPTLKTVSKKAMVHAIDELKAFRQDYAEALRDWRAGRDAVFPAGTWWMARFAGVKVAAA